jgi:NADH:ubiquinone oxidoreductase subunit F (NADH-binding)
MPKVKVDDVCAFGGVAAWSIQGLIRDYRAEFERRVKEHQGQQLEAAE